MIKKSILQQNMWLDFVFIPVLFVAILSWQNWIKIPYSSVFLTILAPIVYIRSTGQDLKDLFITRVGLKKSLLYGLGIGIIIALVEVVAMRQILGGYYPAAQITDFVWWFPLAVLVQNIMGPGLIEEFFFRGFLQTRLAKYMPVFCAIGLQSLIFMLMHWRYVSVGMYYMFFSTFVLAVIAGFLVYKTKNLSGAILMHGLSNAVIVMLFAVNPIVN